MKKHKLDILLEDMTFINANNVIGEIHENEFFIKCKLQIENVIIFYRDCSLLNKKRSKTILEFKNICYTEILLHILLVRLPIWKESVEILNKK